MSQPDPSSSSPEDFTPAPSQLSRLWAMGVALEEAWKAHESQLQAFLKIMMKNRPKEPRFDVIAESNNPAKALADFLRDAAVQAEWKKDFPANLEKLARHLRQPLPLFDKIDSALVGMWCDNQSLLSPLCLLSDSAICMVLEGGDLSANDEMIRQRINRLGLFRPTAPRIGLRIIKKNGKEFFKLVFRKKGITPSRAELETFSESK